MKWQNSLVVNAVGGVEHIGEGILPYLEQRQAEPFAYPQGTLQRKDVFLFISRNFRQEDRESFQHLGIFDGREESCVLFLEAFEDPEVQPIEKYGAGLFPGENCVLLDTFFSGRYIRVTWEGSSSLLCVQTDGQRLTCSLGEQEDQLLILGEHGLRYFRDDAPESRRDSNSDILKGIAYHSYVRTPAREQREASAVFEEELWSEFGSVEAGQTKAIRYRGTAVVLGYDCWSLSGAEYREYTIEGRPALLAGMKEKSRWYRRLERMREESMCQATLPTTFRLWGNDDRLSRVKFLLQKACAANVTVLLTGESGTGKTFLAHEIHKNSKRHEQKFVHVNCAAIPYHLIESELFGYEEGAFTGAKRGGKKGYFEMADGGTIFLDEVTEMPLALQGKLLEVMQNRTFYRVGGTEKVSVNVRVIAATNRDLSKVVAAREFREDLYYRINVFPIELPPLRQRKDAILTIVTEILPGICEKVELEPLLLSPQALEKMEAYSWPGNIRELENLLEKAAILSDGNVILPRDIVLPEIQGAEAEPVTLGEQRERCERQAILAALAFCNGDKGLAARRLDIGRTSLFEKIRKYGVKERWIGGEEDDTE